MKYMFNGRQYYLLFKDKKKQKLILLIHIQYTYKNNYSIYFKMDNKCTSADKNTCKDGFFCPANVPEDATDCTACDNTCATCSAAAASACLTCADGKFFSSNSCTECDVKCTKCANITTECSECKSGNLLSGTTCLACPENCENCAGNKEVCQICKSNFFLKDGKCSTCAANTTEECECGVALNCANCNSGDASKCETCIIGYKKNGDVCNACIDGYMMVNSVCTKCSDSCATCSQGVDLCDTCQAGHQMTINQTCQADCSPALSEGQACVGTTGITCGNEAKITECKCTNAKNCLTCNSDNKKCTSCLPGYKLEADECKNCDDGAEQTGAFCFAPRKESGNLSGGAVTGIVIAVLVVAGGVGGGLAYYFIKRAKK
ncbi:Cysteine-rich membrane protein 1 [Spironucleus salmonicida]|uniref:Cysteine-rich membrane protein 1 n=2 Tax=Spironucleus salmonicida TaxID=348837 RepID=A0A9P8LXI6_9EUKA|nr:Cysteine-rich membrane protein 1 [Spironucleus salmonicida]